MALSLQDARKNLGSAFFLLLGTARDRLLVYTLIVRPSVRLADCRSTSSVSCPLCAALCAAYVLGLLAVESWPL